MNIFRLGDFLCAWHNLAIANKGGRMLAKKYAPWVQAFLMATIMVSLMTFVITWVNTGFTAGFESRWFRAFYIAWPVAYVIIYLFARRVQALTQRICCH